jgi:nucleoside-diphosphate-sugar epimerase
VVAALESDAAAGVYNIADDEVPSLDELLRTMFARRGLPTQIQYVPRALAWSSAAAAECYWWLTSRRGEPPLTRYAVGSLADPSVLDTSRARAVLGYVPRWTYRDGPL